MEVILLGALMVKYDTVVSTFRNLDPFLNIDRNSEGVYQAIIVLKCLFVFYAMENSVPKSWMLTFTAFSKAYLIYMHLEEATYTYIGLILHCVNVCFAQMALLAILATSSKPFEFLLDVYVLFCTVYYACQTYRKEIHKLVAVICLSLRVGSYVDNIQRAEIFRFGVYYLLVMLCLASVFPFLPTRKKYGQRLVFYYMLLVLYIVYKGGQHCNSGGLRYGSDVCSVTQHIYESRHCGLNETLERLCVGDVSNDGKVEKVDLKAGKLSGGRRDVRSGVNVKEASCEYKLIPDGSCSAKVYSAERENLVAEMEERTGGTMNLKIGSKEATRYDRTLVTDMKLDSTEQQNLVTEMEERMDGTINPEIRRIEATRYDRTLETDMKLDSTKRENLVAEIEERMDGTTNPEIGCIEATEYDRTLVTDMKLDNAKKENLVTETEERIDGTTNTEIRLKESMTDIELGSTEQESSETEIKERTDGTIKPETERNEVTENDKASAESYELRLNFDDKKNLLEENSDLEEKMFTENIQDWTEYLLEDEMFSANLFQMNETDGYAEYMDDPSDTSESFPVTEIPDDDIDYDFVNRFGNVEVIGKEVRLGSANKAVKFKSEQSHQKFVAGIQPLCGNERKEKLTRAETEIKQTHLQPAETYVGKEKDAIKNAESININIIKSQVLETDPIETNKGFTVLSQTLPGDHETAASGIKASASSETETSYSETTELQDSDARESKDDSHIATEELEKSQTDYYKEKEREVVKDEGPKERQFKYRKTRWIEEASKGSSKFKASKSDLHSTVQSKPMEGQETGGFVSDSHPRVSTLETKASHSSTRETKTIEALDFEKSQLPTKSIETKDTKELELGASENDLLIAKAFEQDTGDSTENEFAVGDPSGKEYELSNATNFDARDIKPIKLAGLGEYQLKQAEIRHSEESSSGTTRLETTKMVPRISDPKQFKEREIGYFAASEKEVSHARIEELEISKAERETGYFAASEKEVSHARIEELEISKAEREIGYFAASEKEVSHARIEELEIPKDRDPSAREIQPREAVGPKESSLKATKAKETKKAYEGSEPRGTKTGVPRTFERKPTNQREFRYSFANDLNKVNLRQENVLQTTTVSYVETEIEPVNVANLKDNQFKPKNSGGGETCKLESAICSEDIKPQINKAEDLEGIELEMTERSNKAEELEGIKLEMTERSNKAEELEGIELEMTELSNKAEELESIELEMTERGKDFTDVSENLPILVETREAGYLNKASDSKEFGYKAKMTDDFGASDIEVPETKERKVNEMGELEKQDIKVNSNSGIEPKVNTFQSNGPTVDSVLV